MADKVRVLVVANRTAESPELLDALRARAVQGPCEFTLLVPSTPQGIAWAADMHAGDEDAEQHRGAFVEELRGEGLDLKDAKVGDPDPLAAVQDETNFSDYDEVAASGPAPQGEGGHGPPRDPRGGHRVQGGGGVAVRFRPWASRSTASTR